MRPERYQKQRSVNDLGNGISAYELLNRLGTVIPGLYIAEEYAAPGNPTITSLRQRMVGEDGRRAYDSMDMNLERKQHDRYVAPLYRGVLPEHDLFTADGQNKPLIYGWRHVLLLVANETKTSLRDLEVATGLHVYG